MKKLAILLVSIFSSAFCYATYTGGVVGGAVIAPYWYTPDSTPYVTISSHTRVSDGGSNYVDIDPIVGFSGPGAGLTDLDWAELGNFPASCAPQCVVAIGTTLTCGDCSGGGGSGGGNAYTTGGVIGQIPVYVAVDSITASGLIPSRVRTTTTAITGADVNADILLSSNPYIAKTNQYNQFTSSQNITVSYPADTEGKGLEVINSVTPPSMVNDRIGIIAAAQGSDDTLYTAWGIGVAGFGTGDNSRGIGIYGIGKGTGLIYGIYGEASDVTADQNIGVYGKASSGFVNYAGYFDGDVVSTGVYTGSGSGLTNLPASQLIGAVPNTSVDLSTTASKSSDNNFSATQTFQYGLATSTASFSSTATFNSPAQFNGVATSTPAVTNALYKQNITGAWAYFNGTTSPPTLTSGFNIAGIVRTGTAGAYRVYFANDFAAGNAFVCLCGTGRIEANDYGDCVVQGFGNPGFTDISTWDNASTRTDRARVFMICVGAQ